MAGEFSVYLEQAGDAPVHTYVAGGTFGELALMYVQRLLLLMVAAVPHHLIACT